MRDVMVGRGASVGDDSQQSLRGGVCPPQPPCLPQHWPWTSRIPLHCRFKRRASFLSKGGSGHTAEPARVVGYKSMLALPWQWTLL